MRTKILCTLIVEAPRIKQVASLQNVSVDDKNLEMLNSKLFTVALVAVISMIDSLPVSELNPERRSPLELGEKYQGDIILTPEQERIINGTRNSKTGMLNLRYRWPKNSAGFVEVPISYHEPSGYSEFRFLNETIKSR